MVKVLALLPWLSISVALAQSPDIPLKNWSVPPYRITSPREGLQTMADISYGSAFVAVQPCRLVDTRSSTNPNFPAGYGPPALAGGVPRNFDLNSSAQCPGIPNGAVAYSLNVTVTNTTGPGFILIFPKDFGQPTVSTLNYVAGQTVANAAIVPAGTGGAVTVIAGVSGTDLIIDINGYFTNEYNSDRFFYAESLSALPAIIGDNVSAMGNAIGVMGRIPTTTTGSGSAGLRGINQGTGAGGVGVWGSHAGSGWGIYGTSVGGLGVFGTTGSQSIGVAGVRGQDGGGDVPTPAAGFVSDGILRVSAGVRGESHAGNGVYGLTHLGRGVVGVSIIQATGAPHNWGALGSPDYGVWAAGNFSASGSKSFVDPHPTDPSKVIRYYSLEGPESGTYFRGRGKFERGVARVAVPEDFRMVTDREGLTVQITPIGGMAAFGVLKADLNEIVVESSRNLEFYYLVQGVRATHKDLTPDGVGNEFRPEGPDSRLPLWLSEGQKRLLIQNGTYNADGTVNMETARRLGWDKVWEERARPAPLPDVP
jgi:hypothetical protein